MRPRRHDDDRQPGRQDEPGQEEHPRRRPRRRCRRQQAAWRQGPGAPRRSPGRDPTDRDAAGDDRHATTTIKPPTDPQTLGVGPDTKSEAPVAVNEVMADMLSIAMATDVTRNASFVFTLPAAHVFYRAAGADMNDDFHNTICHTDPGRQRSPDACPRRRALRDDRAIGVPGKAGRHARRRRHGARQLAGLRHLVHVVGQGPFSTDEWPVLLAGRAGGAIKGNQHLRYAGQNLTNVLLSIAKSFGANLTSSAWRGGYDQHRAQRLAGIAEPPPPQSAR